MENLLVTFIPRHEIIHLDQIISIFNPAPRTAPANKSRQSLWYCLYLPQLGAVASEEQRECLDSLAQLAQEFSSAISLQPQAIVFEIRSGLKYFGGAESLHVGFKENRAVMFPSNKYHSQHASKVPNQRRYTATLFIEDYEDV